MREQEQRKVSFQGTIKSVTLTFTGDAWDWIR